VISAREHAAGATRLLILACSATKNIGSHSMPAQERYAGPLWQTLRAADPDGSRATVAALSARYGFIAGTRHIDNYNTQLTRKLAQEMAAGGIDAQWPTRSTHLTAEWVSTSARQEIEQLSELQFHEVAIAGGALYLKVMRALVWEFQAAGFISSSARIVEINDSIGLMRKELRSWLTGESVNEPKFRAPASRDTVCGDVMVSMTPRGYVTVKEPDGESVVFTPAAIRRFRDWLNAALEATA
jgi:hypothetical protein